MRSDKIPAFYQIHLLNCRYLADPQQYSPSEWFALRNGKTSFLLTMDEERDLGLILALVETDEQVEVVGLSEVDKAKERLLARMVEDARARGNGLVSPSRAS